MPWTTCLVQVSGVLRNLAVPAHNAAAFAAAGVLPALRAACGALSGQAEVVLNTGRILSKLSLHEGCQELIASDPHYAPLLVGSGCGDKKSIVGVATA